MADESADLTEDVGTGPGCFRWLVRLALLVIIAVLALGGAFCLKKVEAWEVGLRYWNFPVPGLVEKGEVAILEPGFNIIVPYLHQFNRYDSRLQRFEMAPPYENGIKTDLPPLKVRTAKDQDEIDVYVTILYHVKKEMASELRKHYSDNEDIKEKGIKVRCPQILQAKLGHIEVAYDFYSKSKRDLVEEARQEMNLEFGPRGVEIFDVLIRDFKFKDDIEASIISKVIADERVEMESALKEAARARAEWQRLVAEANAAAEVELARGTAKTREIDAEADKYMAEKRALGEKLVLAAQAEGKEKINRALGGPGGKTYVGLEYAKALQGIELIVLPAGPDGVNPLDLDKTLRQIQPGGGK